MRLHGNVTINGRMSFGTPSASRGALLVAAGAMLWGTNGIAAKALFAVAAVSPLEVGFYRLALSVPALALLAWILREARVFRAVGARPWTLFVLSAAMALYQVFYYGAVHRVGAAIASLVTLCSAPVGVATLSAVLLRERLNLGVVLALVMALAGTAVLVGPPTDVGADRQIALVGVAFAFGAGASYAVLTVASRALAAGLCHPLGLIVVGFGGGALLLLPFALADGFGVFHSWTAWLLLLYLGFVPAALAYALFFSGLRSTSATVASVVSLLEPLTATCLAWLIFGERLGVLGIVGASLLLGGLLVLYRNTRARSPGA